NAFRCARRAEKMARPHFSANRGRLGSRLLAIGVSMIDYTYLCQAIADWRSGRRPASGPLPAASYAAPDEVEEVDSSVIVDDQGYAAQGDDQQACAEQGYDAQAYAEQSYEQQGDTAQSYDQQSYEQQAYAEQSYAD